MANSIYNVMYELNASISIGVGTNTDPTIMRIQSSDIVSIAIIHKYDTATYPIIRLRIYADMSLMELINTDPDNVYAGFNAIGGLYKTDNDSNTTSLIGSTRTISVYGKAYIENKNIPVSKMDQYKMGVKDTNDLNVDSKVPFELFIYDEKLMHAMRQKTQAVYRDVTVGTVCDDILKKAGLPSNQIHIDPVQNQKRYNQILIPNLMAIEAFSYFDRQYGLYPHGGSLYYDFTQTPPMMYLCDTDVYASSNISPIYVRTEKMNTEDSCIFKAGDYTYKMQTNALNVSVLTESDIERVMNPEIISDINLTSLESQHTKLTRLFQTSDIDSLPNRIEQKNILHKTDRTTISVQEAARLNEKITKVDVSGSGWDISLFGPNARLNLVFESPIRGLNIGDAYRIRYACHVLSNTSGKLFSSQTTMSLCTN